MICFVLILLSPAAVSAGEAEPELAPLAMKLDAGKVLKYAWTITSSQASKGQELGNAVDLKTEKSQRMSLFLQGEKAPQLGAIQLLLRFRDLSFEETSESPGPLKTSLKVDNRRIYETENEKVIIDSMNDIGLDKITDYQLKLRGMEVTAVRLILDAMGKQQKVEGEKALVDAVHGGNAQSLFPVLANRRVAPGESWDDRFDAPTMGDLKLDEPARMNSRIRFAKWVEQGGKKLAQLELISAWESRDLKGKNQQNLNVLITKLDGRGVGTCLFDPAESKFVDGEMTFFIKYHIHGARDEGSTDLDVDGKTRFTFKWEPGGLPAQGE